MPQARKNVCTRRSRPARARPASAQPRPLVTFRLRTPSRKVRCTCPPCVPRGHDRTCASHPGPVSRPVPSSPARSRGKSPTRETGPILDCDRRRENVELIASGVPNGRSPKVLDFGECGTMVLVSADRADLHGRPHQKSGNRQSIPGIAFGIRPNKLDECDVPAEVEPGDQRSFPPANSGAVTIGNEARLLLGVVLGALHVRCAKQRPRVTVNGPRRKA
jgi:hypothetical protein